MLIVDAQVHIWNAGTASAHHVTGRPDPFTEADLWTEMGAAGVDRAVLAPPAWDPNGNAPSLKAAVEFPDRFAVTGDLRVQGPPDPFLVETWLSQPGMRGMRLIFNRPETQAWLTDGTAEWVWATAEKADIPIMLLVPGGVPLVDQIAARYPGLRLCVDHLGIPRGLKDAPAFEHLPELLALARYPNVSVKAGGLPAYQTTDVFPYPSVHPPLRRVYDAFGPERIFWATDLSRMTVPYAECVTMVTEGISWLSEADKRLIMGEAVCRWLDWPI